MLFEGNIKVTPDSGGSGRFGAGDLLVFPAGLSCVWTVHAPVRKHYRFALVKLDSPVLQPMSVHPLTPDQLQALPQQLPHWSLVNGKLRRELV